MYSYHSPVATDLAPNTNGFIGRRRTPAVLFAPIPIAVGIALALAGACAQAADGVSVVITRDLIGLDMRPEGVLNGGANQINHVPDPDDPLGNNGTSQALVIDFGQDAQVSEAVLGGLFKETVNVNGTLVQGCREVGRWTAFDAAGSKLGTDTFVAEDDSGGVKVVDFVQGPLRYVAFSAEPYRDCDVGLVGTRDSSDYLIRRLNFRFEGQAEATPDASIPNTSEPFAAPLKLENFLAYDPDEPFTDANGNLIDPEGQRLGTATIVIEPGLCEGGTGDGSASSCDVELVADRFTSTFENAGDIQGTLRVRAIETINDERDVCSYPGSSGDAGKLYLNSELTVVEDESDAAIIIPSYLCGIPVDDQPQFTVIELESTLTVRESVIFHTVENLDPAFDCGVPDRSAQPVIGWLPRANEIPVIGLDGMRSRTMEDVTTGCGSTRGSTFRMSYLLFDLRHLPETDYQSVVAGEFEQLRATFLQFAACVNNGTLTSTIESSVDKAARWFGDGRLDKATGELIKLRAEVEDFTSRIGRDLPGCFWSGDTVFAAHPDTEPGEGIEPRNARGDLLSQIDHILYMIESKFDGVQAPADANEGQQSQGKAKGKAKNKKT